MTAIEKAAAKVIALAESEIGYREKATNSQLDDKTANAGSGNYTKYAAFFDEHRNEIEFYNGRKNGFDWCDMFFDWLQCQAWGIDTGRKVLYQPLDSCGAGCAWSASYYRENGAWYKDPLPGDQIFFGPYKNESHTGLVAEVTDDRVITIEGNANNIVMKRSYSKGYDNIAGYGRPNYNLVADQFKEPEKPAPKYLTEAEVIALVDKHIKAAVGEYINTFEDLPEWAKPEIRELIEIGALRGTEPSETVEGTKLKGPVNALIRPCIVAFRAIKQLLKEENPS